NLGGSAARNTGIKAADSPYVAFLDDDDKWFPEKLRLQVDLLTACPPTVAGVYTGSLTIDRETQQILSYNVARKRGSLYSELLHYNWIGGTSTILLRRNCFEKVELFDEVPPSFQDYDLWIRIAKCFDFEVIERPLFEYYVHKNKIWANPDAISRGMELLLHKHGKSPGLRKYFSNYYLSLGVFFSYKGDTKRAVRSYLRAITLHPYEVRHYFNLCLCLLGGKNYERGKRVRASFVKALHQVAPQQPL